MSEQLFKSQLKYTSENKKGNEKLVGCIYAVGIHSNSMRKIKSLFGKNKYVKIVLLSKFILYITIINQCMYIHCLCASKLSTKDGISNIVG